MKAVVVEIKENFAAVLQDDGTVVRVMNNNYNIGQKIDIKNSIFRGKNKLLALVASAAMLFMMLGAGTWVYISPSYYVSLDVNPSIEYSVNRVERVIHAKGINDDGAEILKEIGVGNLKNKNIEHVIAQTVDQFASKAYLDDEGGVVVATAGKDMNKAEELVQKLQVIIEGANKENGYDVEILAYAVGIERVEKAKELGVTPGKLRLVELLKGSSSDPDNIRLEEWLDKPVKEIMKTSIQNKKNEKNKKHEKNETNEKNEIKNEAANKDMHVKEKEKNNSTKAKRPIKVQEKAAAKTEKASDMKNNASGKPEKPTKNVKNAVDVDRNIFNKGQQQE